MCSDGKDASRIWLNKTSIAEGGVCQRAGRQKHATHCLHLAHYFVERINVGAQLRCNAIRSRPRQQGSLLEDSQSVRPDEPRDEVRYGDESIQCNWKQHYNSAFCYRLTS
jgi:hypothetical protein